MRSVSSAAMNHTKYICAIAWSVPARRDMINPIIIEIQRLCPNSDMNSSSKSEYLGNRFMQFAHARCLVKELEDLGAPSRTPSRVAWPHGFNSMHAAASPRGNRPPEYDSISFLGGDEPHYNYPLRNVGETNFKITYDPLAADSTIGEVNLRQALRECYPGATYLHLAKPFRVFGWKMGAFGSYILVETLIQRGRTTKPQITTWIAASLISPAVLENHVRHS